MRAAALFKSKNLNMLYWLPFIVAGIMAVRFGLEPAVIFCADKGVISVPFWSGISDNPWVMGGVLFLSSLGVFAVADKYKLLGQRTALPAVIYALLTVGIVCRYGINNYFYAAVCMVLGIEALLCAILNTKQNASVFNFGMFVTLAVLLCPKLVMLLPWAIVVLPFSGRVTVKDTVAFLIGVSAILVFTLTYYFYFGELERLKDYFVEGLLNGSDFWKLFPDKYWVFGLLALQLVVIVFYILLNFPAIAIAQRRGVFAMFSLSLFLGSSLFFIPFNCQGVLLIVFLPLAYLFSLYFISHRHRWAGIVLFLLFLATCVGLII